MLAIIPPINNIGNGVTSEAKCLKALLINGGNIMPKITRVIPIAAPIKPPFNNLFKILGLNPRAVPPEFSETVSRRMTLAAMPQNNTVFTIKYKEAMGAAASPNSAMFTGNPINAVFERAKIAQNVPRRVLGTFKTRAKKNPIL